jgi:hypothetical protein
VDPRGAVVASVRNVGLARAGYPYSVGRSRAHDRFAIIDGSRLVIVMATMCLSGASSSCRSGGEAANCRPTPAVELPGEADRSGADARTAAGAAKAAKAQRAQRLATRCLLAGIIGSGR